MAELKKKYGLITAICMVVGIVVGSGVFFKAEAMLNITNGDLPVALLSWLIGGCVMVISAYTFAVMGTIPRPLSAASMLIMSDGSWLRFTTRQ